MSRCWAREFFFLSFVDEANLFFSLVDVGSDVSMHGGDEVLYSPKGFVTNGARPGCRIENPVLPTVSRTALHAMYVFVCMQYICT